LTASAKSSSSLDEWIDAFTGGAVDDWTFPSDALLNEFVDSIQEQEEDKVRSVIRALLVPSRSFPFTDALRLRFLKAGGWEGVLSPQDLERHRDRLDFRVTELDRRLILFAAKKSKSPPWEGVTWVLDLLPGFPRHALDGLEAYLLAHAQDLPDGAYSALQDALTLIRARYIGLPGSMRERIGVLLQLPSRDFEHLVERYYAEMGYRTELTPPRSDGGRDVIADRDLLPVRQRIRVECKNWNKAVGVKEVRALLGVIADEKATNGVLVATSGFTKPARDLAERNPSLTLLSGTELVLEMNAHLGARWPQRIDRFLVESRKSHGD
jgi:restriction system protein